ncbi:MAG: hypothetical protein KF862_25560 [Chitinophagaceae bacterium]|nr:hypothetical protein [Chitinophagaceae bacterium]
MKSKYLLPVFMLSVLFSCRKENNHSPGTPAEPFSFVDLKLKNIQITGLPSPYYHFEYRDDKYISGFNFSNGLIYEMDYTGDDLTLMKNNTAGASPERISYSYINNQLSYITVTDEGITYRRAFLWYYPSGQLQKIEWELKLDNGLFAEDQSYTFTYYPDGNVKEVLQQYFPAGQLPEAAFTDRYENYDNKKNADGFTLMEPGRLRIPILIPGINVQVNNAGRVVRTGGAAVTYEVNYTYTYDNSGRPLVKIGDFVNTSGPGTGQHYELRTTYSYYN